MQTGAVSVAMATFNGERFLAEQLRSLAQQDHLPAELVICDDQSTDRTAAIIADFARTAPFPVRFHRNETRLRFSDNFMKAIALCESDHIAFCDQDDVWLPGKIARSLAAMTATGALMCSHRVELIDEAGARIGTSTNLSRRALLEGAGFEPWGVFLGFTCTIDRRLLHLIDPAMRPHDLIEYERPMSHDRWFYLVAGLFGSLCYIDEPLALYRQHGANVFGRTRTTKLHGLAKAVRKYPAYIRQRGRIAAETASLLARVRDAIASPEFDGAAERWSGVAEFYAVREAVFSQRAPLTRLRRLFAAYRRQLYSRGWGRGGRSLIVQDAIAAIIVR
ncbi:glycosyltransferase family 2 protein [Sphingomonas sp. CV7422]|uniref:glycosyltransferase family 2 protein n=1 Tax=Sphingomonas sp. CV7422 TaxID=3018036 RepID=UPI0022FF1C33|nr:glycosyltransferase family 2 protein [Sphingomonas sp. CV7422]